MNKKILQFLKDAGFKALDHEPAAIQLIRYFEDSYGVSLLKLLEQEWITEQFTRELTHQDFEALREFVDDGNVIEFDKTIATIEAYEL